MGGLLASQRLRAQVEDAKPLLAGFATGDESPEHEAHITQWRAPALREAHSVLHKFVKGRFYDLEAVSVLVEMLLILNKKENFPLPDIMPRCLSESFRSNLSILKQLLNLTLLLEEFLLPLLRGS